MRMPVPNVGYSRSFESAVVELLSCTKFPAISASCCGASRSESSVLGTMPAMLNRHSLFTIARSPLAFVPLNPSALCSASTSVITAWHGSHCPM